MPNECGASPSTSRATRAPASRFERVGEFGGRGRGLGLYVHFPYCVVRCTYCDFNTYVAIGMVRMTHWDSGTELTAQTPDGPRPAMVHETFWN